ncbi:hypothetical protein GGU45_000612 [Niabella hirudinis]
MKKIITGITALVLCGAISAQTKQVQYLSGTGSNQTVAWDFYCTGGRSSGYWTTIQVPSCWEQQGFGNYNYGRDYKTYGKNFRFADEKGMYKYMFQVPASWRGKEVFIVFEGSMTDTEVKINGRAAGATHRGAFYRFKYNITDKLVFGGKNLLEATVSKMSADPTVNNAERLADYWIFGGIFRPVYLEAVNKKYIDYVAIDAKADGGFALQAALKGISGSASVVADITDAKGTVLATATKMVNKGDSLTELRTTVKRPLLWTSETPNLYNVNVYLKENGKTVYRLNERFGFRTIEVRHGDGIYVNGVQVKMKGVNRHCWSPETGRTLNDSLQLLDVKLIKEMNMNAVRCSHYPPDQRFLELCDSLGLYVLDELAGWQKAYSTEAGKPLVKEMILKDVNHPSIIFWDNGNEGGTNKSLDAEFYRWDYSKRPVIHPHHRPGNAFSGIDCNHYEDYYSTKKILDDSLIYMPTEFLHAQDDGGAGSGMYDFWELHWNAKRSGGGFIWAFVDEGVVRTDMNGIIDANGLNANDGILGPHREKEGSFYALREIFSPVRIAMDTLPSGFNGEISIENRYHFTNLNEVRYNWFLVDFYKPFDLMNRGYMVKEKGSASAPSVKPLQKGVLKLGLPAGFRKYDALQLQAVDKRGNEIYKWTWKLQDNPSLLKTVWGNDLLTTSATESDSSITLAAGGLQLQLNKRTGMLTEVKNTLTGLNNLSFKNGPVLVKGISELRDVKLEQGSATFRYTGNMKTVRWQVLANGWVRLDYEYELEGSQPFAGVSFDYPENYILYTRWLGKGPYRQWKNRTQGTPVNLWQNFYNNTKTGYWPMVYPEFKGYYGDITWMEFSTAEGKFFVASEQPGLNVRLFDFYGLTGAPPFPQLPPGNISFLDAIPPMGSKLALGVNRNTASLGPQSELAKLNGPVKRTLYFYFGLPKISNAKEPYSRPRVDNVF